MEQKFWQEKWSANELGFHQDSVHPLLDKYKPDPGLERGARVFVPLCGKSRDMLHLQGQGFKVIGLELSEIAVQSFFKENDLEFTVNKLGDYTHFQSSDIEIYCGDFFSVTNEVLGNFSAVFDRAALIALPPEMRIQYSDKMRRLCARETKILLITLEYAQGLINAPPFTVLGDEVRSLYDSWCDIEFLEKAAATVKGKLCHELAYRLKVL